MAISSIKRIKQFIDYKGITVSRFEKEVGMSNGSFASQLKNNKTIGVDKLENILKVFPELNAEWLLTGLGDMINCKTKNEVYMLNEPTEPYLKPREDEQLKNAFEKIILLQEQLLALKDALHKCEKTKSNPNNHSARAASQKLKES